jgi:hypothetical protein
LVAGSARCRPLRGFSSEKRASGAAYFGLTQLNAIACWCERDNLEARIIEAKREGWLGEVEGLQVSLAGAKNKIAQLDQTLARRAGAVELGMPQFADLAGRSITAMRTQT